MQELPYYNSFFQCAHPPAIELGEILSNISTDGFSRVFYTGSGSEANDTVIRMVRRFWQLQDKPEKQIIIARKNAYHGSTIAAASLGGMEGMHAQGAGIPIPNIIHIAQPYWFQEGRDIDPNTFGIAVAEELDKNGNVSRTKMARGANKGGNAEVVANAGVNRESGWLYFIDKDGDVSRAKMARGRK
jgi:putrescine aminotransferase